MLRYIFDVPLSHHTSLGRDSVLVWDYMPRTAIGRYAVRGFFFFGLQFSWPILLDEVQELHDFVVKAA